MKQRIESILILGCILCITAMIYFSFNPSLIADWIISPLAILFGVGLTIWSTFRMNNERKK